MSRSFIRLLAAVVVLSAAVVCLQAQETLSFSIGVYDQKDKVRYPNWSQDIKLGAKDGFAFTVGYSANTVVYILYEDVDGMITPIDPLTDGARLAENRYRIPDEGYYEMTGSGTERLYIIALPAKDKSLDDALAALDKLGANASDREAKAASSAVLDAVDKLRKATSGLTRPAEKPITMAGTTRSANSVAAPSDGVQIEVGKGYVKTIRFVK